MKKEKLGALVFWVSLLVLAVCAFLLVGRPTLIPTGIPGDAVAFGMGAEEVTQTAGPPDGTRSENGVRTGFFLYYYQREVLGCPATVSYTFHGRQESPAPVWPRRLWTWSLRPRRNATGCWRRCAPTSGS